MPVVVVIVLVVIVVVGSGSGSGAAVAFTSFLILFPLFILFPFSYFSTFLFINEKTF